VCGRVAYYCARALWLKGLENHQGEVQLMHNPDDILTVTSTLERLLQKITKKYAAFCSNSEENGMLMYAAGSQK